MCGCGAQMMTRRRRARSRRNRGAVRQPPGMAPSRVPTTWHGVESCAARHGTESCANRLAWHLVVCQPPGMAPSRVPAAWHGTAFTDSSKGSAAIGRTCPDCGAYDSVPSSPVRPGGSPMPFDARSHI